MALNCELVLFCIAFLVEVSDLAITGLWNSHIWMNELPKVHCLRPDNCSRDWSLDLYFTIPFSKGCIKFWLF